MYADRYGAGPKVKPGSMTLAVGMTALPIVALIMGLQISHTLTNTKDPTVFNVPIKAPPPPDTKPVETKEKPMDQKIVVPQVQTPIPVELPRIDTTFTPPPVPPSTLPPGTGEAPVPPVVTPIKPPVLTNALNNMSQSMLQPPYPAEEIRMGRSGKVSLRVLIGTDGRVKQVARLSATSDAFYNSAEKQALTKWRFKPATSDGTPIEQWKAMNLSFVLADN